MSTTIGTVTLNNGVEMPRLGYGVYQITDPAECERAVTLALDAGYRLIDTAANYGNEVSVGRAIAASGVAREELFVTTKVQPQDGTFEGTKKAFAQSLDRLGLEYVDLYLQHMPFNDVFGSWRAMEEFAAAGTAGAIGVSNFSAERLQDFVLHTNTVPAVNQIEFHPLSQQKAVRAVMAEHDIVLNAWGPFAQGREGLFDNETIAGIAEKKGKTPAQVILRWHYQQGVVAIPKSTNPERLVANLDVFDFGLSDTEIDAINALDEDKYLMKSPLDPQLIRHITSPDHYTA
ncbi:MAG: aldo/keto reductase [Mycetocola sp.]